MMAYDHIAGERRADRRYELNLEVRWKLIRRRKVMASGTGRTVDLSSGGIRIDAGQALRPGLDVELSVSWPVLLNNAAPLQLFVTGRIERSQGTEAGIRMIHHEFRTAGAHGGLGEQRDARRIGAVTLVSRIPGRLAHIQ